MIIVDRFNTQLHGINNWEVDITDENGVIHDGLGEQLGNVEREKDDQQNGADENTVLDAMLEYMLQAFGQIRVLS